MNNTNFTIISFYQFRKLTQLVAYKILFKEFCSFHKLRGTIILSKEGINGTIAGLDQPINQLEKKLKSKGFDNLELKYSYYKYMPFNRLKIRIKKEIITFSNLKLDVENNTAKHVNAKDWNYLLENKDTLLIDVRNKFEFEVGTFENAISSETKNFSDFKKFVDNYLFSQKEKKIAMFCTGGIRCEKASSFMINKGFNNIFQLKGGVLKYLEEVAKKDSKWKGECFVFDNRVSVQSEMAPGTFDLCHGCRMPVSAEDQKSDKFQKGVTCPQCFFSLSQKKKKKLLDRNKQIEIAKRKGIYSPYIKFTPTDFS